MREVSAYSKTSEEPRYNEIAARNITYDTGNYPGGMTKKYQVAKDVQRAIDGLKDISDDEFQEFFNDEIFIKDLDVVDSWGNDRDIVKMADDGRTEDRDQAKNSRDYSTRNRKSPQYREYLNRDEKRRDIVRRDPYKSSKDIEHDRIRMKGISDNRFLAENEKANKHKFGSDKVCSPGAEVEVIRGMTLKQENSESGQHFRSRSSRERHRSRDRRGVSPVRRRSHDRTRPCSHRRRNDSKYKRPVRISPERRKTTVSPGVRRSWERRTSRENSEERHRRHEERELRQPARRSRSRDRPRSRSSDRYRTRLSRSPFEFAPDQSAPMPRTPTPPFMRCRESPEHAPMDFESDRRSPHSMHLTHTKERSRSPSPSPSQTNIIEFKATMQRTRVVIFTQIRTQCIECPPTSVEEVESQIDLLTKTWEEFCSDHLHLGSWSGKSFLEHSYVTDDVYNVGFQEYYKSSSALYKLKNHIQKRGFNESHVNSSLRSKSHARHSPSLPDIRLPEFSGDLSTWPAFKDHVDSLIIRNDDLNNAQRFQCLKTSLTGSLAQLISDIPTSNDAFDDAWDMICKRFDEKERFIFSYVAKLFADTEPVRKIPEGLHSLVSSTRKNLEALNNLGVQTEHWNYILLHFIVRRLNPEMRDQWETKRRTLGRPTQLKQLLDFIDIQASAYEVVQHASAPLAKKIKRSEQSKATSPRTIRPQRSKSPKSTRRLITAPPAQYPCDHCSGNHYIVTCPEFRQLSPAERHEIVTEYRLCYNCFGHHNLAVCNSTHTCKKCSSKHHTMIHLPTTTRPWESSMSKTRKYNSQASSNSASRQ